MSQFGMPSYYFWWSQAKRWQEVYDKQERKMEEPKIFIRTHYDSGLCRTYYRVKGDNLHRVYCRYDGEDFMYVCSKDGEPSHCIGETKYIIEE